MVTLSQTKYKCPTGKDRKVATMAKQMYTVNGDNYSQIIERVPELKALGLFTDELAKAISEYEQTVLSAKAVSEFAHYVINEVIARGERLQAFNEEPITIINNAKGNTLLGGTILTLYGAREMQGLIYILADKFDKYGMHKAVVKILVDDFKIENGKLVILDYKDKIREYEYSKYNGKLFNGIEVKNLLTYENYDLWQKQEEDRIAKNEKASEKANKTK